MKSILIGTFMLVFSVVTLGAGWTDPLTVEKIMTEGKSDLIIIVTSGGAPSYSSGCIANNWIIDSDNDSRRGRVYSTAMAALLAGKKITLWYADTCSSWNYHGATAIQLSNQD